MNEQRNALGLRIKHRRMVMGLKIADLAELAGCSESMISKIENGKANPSLKALQRIANALDTQAATLMSEGTNETMIIRDHDRPKLHITSFRSSEDIVMESLAPYSPSRLLQANIHVVPPGVHTNETYSHEGEDLGYVLEGKLELWLGEDKHLLNPGDSFIFRSEIPHGYANPGDVITRVLWVNTPPSF